MKPTFYFDIQRVMVSKNEDQEQTEGVAIRLSKSSQKQEAESHESYRTGTVRKPQII